MTKIDHPLKILDPCRGIPPSPHLYNLQFKQIAHYLFNN
jgi:hypothetical protein